jgi:hypothetical protein
MHSNIWNGRSPSRSQRQVAQHTARDAALVAAGNAAGVLPDPNTIPFDPYVGDWCQLTKAQVLHARGAFRDIGVDTLDAQAAAIQFFEDAPTTISEKEAMDIWYRVLAGDGPGSPENRVLNLRLAFQAACDDRQGRKDKDRKEKNVHHDAFEPSQAASPSRVKGGAGSRAVRTRGATKYVDSDGDTVSMSSRSSDGTYNGDEAPTRAQQKLRDSANIRGFTDPAVLTQPEAWPYVAASAADLRTALTAFFIPAGEGTTGWTRDVAIDMIDLAVAIFAASRELPEDGPDFSPVPATKLISLLLRFKMSFLGADPVSLAKAAAELRGDELPKKLKKFLKTASVKTTSRVTDTRPPKAAEVTADQKATAKARIPDRVWALMTEAEKKACKK